MHTHTIQGRDDLIADTVREIRKGKHVCLAGPVGIGKSALLLEALKQIEPRQSEWTQFDPVEYEKLACGDASVSPTAGPDQHGAILVYLTDHQAKAQFVAISRRLIETGILKPSTLELAKRYDAMPPATIPWRSIRRQVSRLSMKDLTSAIIPALHAYTGKVLVAVDDMTALTPTQQAFWLAIFEQAQVLSCASSRKTGLRKLWWKMRIIDVPALAPTAATAMVRETIASRGMLIESPELYIGHVVKQAGGNPQAIVDMLDESAKEKRVDKRQIRQMRHAAGVSYMDFTPVMIVAGAMIVGMRYMAIGLGDTALYVLAGVGAALFLALRFFLSRGSSGGARA